MKKTNFRKKALGQKVREQKHPEQKSCEIGGLKKKAEKNRRILKTAAAGKKGTEAGHRGSGRIDYHSYDFSTRETFRVTAVYAVLSGVIVWLFYSRPAVLITAIPIYPFYLKLIRKQRAEARRKQIGFDFRSALNSLSVSLRAGRSVENAFIDAASELKVTIGEESCVTKEFGWIARQIRLSVPIELLLSDFAGRSGVEDIENFTAVFTAAKRMGGDMAGILRSAAESIEGRIEVEREIEMTLAAKRMEQRVMTAMPCGIIVYMRLASPGFLDLMYTSALGALVMTGCLAAYAGAVYWSARIVDIEV